MCEITIRHEVVGLKNAIDISAVDVNCNTTVDAEEV
jgi:hypothetical protein